MMCRGRRPCSFEKAREGIIHQCVNCGQRSSGYSRQEDMVLPSSASSQHANECANASHSLCAHIQRIMRLNVQDVLVKIQSNRYTGSSTGCSRSASPEADRHHSASVQLQEHRVPITPSSHNALYILTLGFCHLKELWMDESPWRCPESSSRAELVSQCKAAVCKYMKIEMTA